MNISEKIDHVRRQPEHIRMRYVWGCVALSMLVVMIIWGFSVASLFKSKDIDPNAPDSVANLKKQLQTVSEQTPSLKNFSEQPLTVGNEGVENNTDTNDFKYPAADETSEIPQSSAYSEQ